MRPGCVARTGEPNCHYPGTKHIKDKLDAAGDSQLLEDSVDVIPDGMFLYFESLSDFAVLQAVGDEANHIFLATRQQGHSSELLSLTEEA